eukprot:m.32588 g.32588  ORF g.32588 m.32588 type:complete len:601 (+) comp7062_c0_seq2:1363-3165(+)
MASLTAERRETTEALRSASTQARQPRRREAGPGDRVEFIHMQPCSRCAIALQNRVWNERLPRRVARSTTVTTHISPLRWRCPTRLRHAVALLLRVTSGLWCGAIATVRPGLATLRSLRGVVPSVGVGAGRRSAVAASSGGSLARRAVSSSRCGIAAASGLGVTPVATALSVATRAALRLRIDLRVIGIGLLVRRVRHVALADFPLEEEVTVGHLGRTAGDGDLALGHPWSTLLGNVDMSTRCVLELTDGRAALANDLSHHVIRDVGFDPLGRHLRWDSPSPHHPTHGHRGPHRQLSPFHLDPNHLLSLSNHVWRTRQRDWTHRRHLAWGGSVGHVNMTPREILQLADRLAGTPNHPADVLVWDCDHFGDDPAIRREHKRLVRHDRVALLTNQLRHVLQRLFITANFDVAIVGPWLALGWHIDLGVRETLQHPKCRTLLPDHPPDVVVRDSNVRLPLSVGGRSRRHPRGPVLGSCSLGVTLGSILGRTLVAGLGAGEHRRGLERDDRRRHHVWWRWLCCGSCRFCRWRGLGQNLWGGGLLRVRHVSLGFHRVGVGWMGGGGLTRAKFRDNIGEGFTTNSVECATVEQREGMMEGEEGVARG